jgi:sugar/nucleoside kinase (ribokinase family)
MEEFITKNVQIIMNTQSDATLLYWNIVLKFFPYINILITNLDEATLIINSDISNSNSNSNSTCFYCKLEIIINKYKLKNWIITLGKEGALWISYSNDKFNIKYFEQKYQLSNKKIIDTTGCGDAFVSGILLSLSLNKPITESIDNGNKFGAIACTVIGGSSDPFSNIKEISPSSPLINRNLDQNKQIYTTCTCIN